MIIIGSVHQFIGHCFIPLDPWLFKNLTFKVGVSSPPSRLNSAGANRNLWTLYKNNKVRFVFIIWYNHTIRLIFGVQDNIVQCYKRNFSLIKLQKCKYVHKHFPLFKQFCNKSTYNFEICSNLYYNYIYSVLTLYKC